MRRTLPSLYQQIYFIRNSLLSCLETLTSLNFYLCYSKLTFWFTLYFPAFNVIQPRWGFIIGTDKPSIDFQPNSHICFEIKIKVVSLYNYTNVNSILFHSWMLQSTDCKTKLMIRYHTCSDMPYAVKITIDVSNINRLQATKNSNIDQMQTVQKRKKNIYTMQQELQK